MAMIEIINKEALSLAAMSESLKNLEKRDGELNFRAKKVKEYIEQIKPMSAKEAKAFEEKLTKLDVPRLKSQHVAKLVDLHPRDMDTLKALFSTEHITIKNEDLEKILTLLKES